MFISFFPNPKWFFLSALLWAIFTTIAWFNFLGLWPGFIDGLQSIFSIAPLFGDAVVATMQATPEQVTALGLDPNAGPHMIPNEAAVWVDENRIWLYQYVFVATALFSAAWLIHSEIKGDEVANQRHWYRWSILGAALILLVSFGTVQVSAWLNDWNGQFGNLLQATFSETNQNAPEGEKITAGQFFTLFIEVAIVLLINITILVFLLFFERHYVFRWRTAMTDHYMRHWQKIRHIEGAAQRVQDDTFRFSGTVEDLGDSFISSVMTLLVFLPILYELSESVGELPIIGDVDGSLIFFALFSAILGTVILAAAGFKLPGINFDLQKTEAALRKELVYGEDDAQRASPKSFAEYYRQIAKTRFRYYFHLLYFDVARFAYARGSSFIPLFIMIPGVVAGQISLGIFNRISSAFGQVEDSLKFLVNSWSTIVALLSVYKRLRQLDYAIEGRAEGSLDSYGAKVS